MAFRVVPIMRMTIVEWAVLLLREHDQRQRTISAIVDFRLDGAGSKPSAVIFVL